VREAFAVALQATGGSSGGAGNVETRESQEELQAAAGNIFEFIGQYVYISN
jgi:hypothetical protein